VSWFRARVRALRERGLQARPGRQPRDLAEGEQQELAPSKHDDVAKSREFAVEFVEGLFITTIQGAKSIKAGQERRLVTGDIQVFRTQIATVQARPRAAQAEHGKQGDGDEQEGPRSREV